MTIYPSLDLSMSLDKAQDPIYDFGPLSLQQLLKLWLTLLVK